MGWTRGHTIGHGSSATVSVARDCSSGEVFAVKSMELSESKVLQREQRILSKLISPYIVKYLGCDVRMENGVVILYNLFMEYVSGGTLVDLVRKQGGSLDEDMIRARLREILEGLGYLHSNGIVHCDIKGSNILVGSDGAKIADLGCAKCLERPALNDVEEDKTTLIAGTPLFMAPEVARGEEQGFAADVWAVGCVVIEMATGCAPWTNVTDPMSILYRIACSDEIPEVPSFLSDQAKDFLSKCLIRNPEERWSVERLLKHPFLVEPYSNFMSFQVLKSNSPISVLDQDLWSSIQEWNAVSNLTNTSDSNSNSPSMRLRQFSRGGNYSSPSTPNWNSVENWVTVRSNSSDGSRDSITTIEIEKTTEVNTVLISQEVDMELLPENCVAFEDLFKCFVTDTGTGNNGSNSEIPQVMFNVVILCSNIFNFESKQNFRFTHSFNSFTRLDYSMYLHLLDYSMYLHLLDYHQSFVLNIKTKLLKFSNHQAMA